MGHTIATPAVSTGIIVVKTIILVLGGLITYFSLKAYRRTDARPLGLLSLGFGIITFGALVAGAIHMFLDITLAEGVLVDASVTMVGLMVITYSLYAR
jgi:hypothetical protein